MIRNLGTILVIASAFISYSEKYIVSNNIQFKNNCGYNNSADLVWAASIVIAPIILSIGANLNPYRFSYIFPVFVYSTYLFFVFSDDKKDLGWSGYYATVVTILFVIFMFLMSKTKKREKQIKEEEAKKITFLEQMLDLSYNVINRN